MSITLPDSAFIDDLLAAIAAGVDPEEYLAARDAGATTSEIIQIHHSSLSLPTYTVPRRAGATHAETLAAFNAGTNLLDYAAARTAGATHAELTSGLLPSSPDLLKRYVALRATGISHANTRQLADLWINWDNYVEAAHAGATFNEILNAHANRVDLHLYAMFCAAPSLPDHAAVLAHARRVLPGIRPAAYDTPY